MNQVRKIYCRAFQTVFKIALPVLPYRKPKLAGSVKALPEIIEKNNCSRVLIITDPGIQKLRLTARLERALKDAGMFYRIYGKTCANPTTDNVYEALELYQENACDAIIGFGGGSSMDCAKAVGACAVKPKQPLEKMKGILKVHKRLPLLIAIPTTAGTGSETTLAAVSLIFENLETAYANGQNLEARKQMLRASFFAGCAFTKSYVGYVHAVAHSLGGEYNVPHGLANAVLLPFVLEAYGPCIHKKLHRLAVAAHLADWDTPDQEAAKRFIDAIKRMK